MLDGAQPRTRVGRFLQRRPLLTGGVLSLSLFLGTLLMAEGVAALYAWQRGPVGVEGFRNEIPMTWKERDAYMGFRPKASGSDRSRKTGDGLVVYDFQYSIDEYHRRVTPVTSPKTRPKFAVFLGGSYTFGEGVEDHETLPAYFAGLAPAYAPYNYAYRAYGPQQAYLQVKRPGFREEIEQDAGIFFYLFIDHHIDRLTGRMRVVGSWGENLPYLTAGPAGWEHHGSFGEAWSIRSPLYRLLCKSALLRVLEVDWPPAIREQDLRLTASMLKSTADAAASLYPNSPFYVIFHPTSRHAAVLAGMLEESGVRYLDYSGMFDRDPPAEGTSYFLADGHPTAYAHARLARQIVTDLELSSPP
jgi:hypothetical protein